MNLYMFVIFSVLFNKLLAQDLCERHTTCSQCIRDYNKCVWCGLDNFNESRCISEIAKKDDWCLNNVKNPQSTINTTEDLDFNSNNKEKIIQIKPQKNLIQIRSGQSVDFEFSFKPAKDYPVDIYFLFDESSTMVHIKDKVANQSQAIYNDMKSMTNNVYFGIGSFVDKNVIPFTNDTSVGLAFSFKNRLKLTDNLEKYKQVISEATNGLNDDPQDGHLDALSQVIICKNEIGWRDESTKIIVVLTNSPIHVAGDGYLAGIREPYDGKCYTENGTYTKELVMDYPSLNIINKMATDDQIAIIFATDLKGKRYYESLPMVINRVKIVDFDDNKNDAVSSLRSIYKDITGKIKVKVKMNSDHRKHFDISINKCGSDIGNFEKNYCTIKQGEIKIIKGTIKLLDYFEDNNIQANILIEGINENLNLIINIMKECDCESEDNAEYCNKAGTKRCGVCECNADKYGKKCECNASELSTESDPTCIAPNSTSLECSGQGVCLCGICTCSKSYNGEFCQCNDRSCKRGPNNEVCSNNGKCYCGACICAPNWIDDDCSCNNSTAECIESHQDITNPNINVCNSRGVCECGKCICNNPAEWEGRKELDGFCNPICSNPEACHTRQCILLEPYVLGYLSDEVNKHSQINISKISYLTELDNETWSECQEVRVDVGCYTRYVYKYNTSVYGIDVLLQSNLNCAESYYMYGGGCLLTLILIGIATLAIWKYLTVKRDRREYEQFIKEAEGAQEFQNDSFCPANTFVSNPTFRKSSIHR